MLALRRHRYPEAPRARRELRALDAEGAMSRMRSAGARLDVGQQVGGERRRRQAARPGLSGARPHHQKTMQEESARAARRALGGPLVNEMIPPRRAVRARAARGLRRPALCGAGRSVPPRRGWRPSAPGVAEAVERLCAARYAPARRARPGAAAPGHSLVVLGAGTLRAAAGTTPAPESLPGGSGCGHALRGGNASTERAGRQAR